jgi:lipopolysaccharide heptosyltransferase II
MTAAQRILVRGPNWAGDLVMSTPAFRAIRAAHPRAEITLQLRPGLAPLVAGAPWFDSVVPVASYRRGPGALVREGWALRSRAFDLGLCLPDSFSSALLMRWAGVRTIVGYGGGARRALLHRAVEPPSGPVARERHALGLALAAGSPPRGTQLELFTTEREEEGARRLLSDHGIDEGAPLVALAPGASYGPSKVWPPESFAAVGDALAGLGAQVALVGAPSEAPLAEQVRRAMRQRVTDLTEALDLGLLKAVLRRARLLVCNDAGARHVAVAFGVPCVVLFGPTSLAKTNLNLERVRALAADVGCRPCYHRVCPIDHRCMRRLDPARVVEAARPALEGGFRGDGRLRALPGAPA